MTVNGLDELAITKLDVLTGLPELEVCVAYELDGERLAYPPYERIEAAEPVYDDARRLDRRSLQVPNAGRDLPPAAQQYLARIEREVGCRVGRRQRGPRSRGYREPARPVQRLAGDSSGRSRSRPSRPWVALQLVRSRALAAPAPRRTLHKPDFIFENSFISVR